MGRRSLVHIELVREVFGGLIGIGNIELRLVVDGSLIDNDFSSVNELLVVVATALAAGTAAGTGAAAWARAAAGTRTAARTAAATKVHLGGSAIDFGIATSAAAAPAAATRAAAPGTAAARTAAPRAAAPWAATTTTATTATAALATAAAATTTTAATEVDLGDGHVGRASDSDIGVRCARVLELVGDVHVVVCACDVSVGCGDVIRVVGGEFARGERILLLSAEGGERERAGRGDGGEGGDYGLHAAVVHCPAAVPLIDGMLRFWIFARLAKPLRFDSRTQEKVFDSQCVKRRMSCI
ncbi:hypothetical protein BDN70DRAFT_965861 [Pholiota conissans]|uniref:Uncharacterized protein n=1 Tax=Pholiota conissans TaxID=109636 RepID=A0A9P5YSV2_9AGAR|nr:hypothetical protein BDN70DRAFT_965861 [Pholiota conissans]